MTIQLSNTIGLFCAIAVAAVLMSGAAAPPAHADAFCSIHDGVGFGGAERKIPENVEHANLSSIGFSKAASSAKADERCRLLLYPEPNFAGARYAMPKGLRVADLTTVGFDDKAQSLRCICDGSR